MGPHWFVFKDMYSVCVPEKNGCSAFRCAAFETDEGLAGVAKARRLGLGPFDKPDKSLPCYLAVREPVDRFASFWRNKIRDGQGRAFNKMKGWSPDKFMDHVERNADRNAHWARQSTWAFPGVILVPYKLLLPTLGLPDVQKNVTESRQDDPPMPVQRILNHYSRDAELWEKACAEFNYTTD